MRLFLALPLPEALTQALTAFQQRARALGLEATWPRPEGLHLTLAFLGEQPEATVGRILQRLPSVTGCHGRFRLQTRALGGFPKASAARILWLGLEPEPRLEALATDLRALLTREALPFDPKPFKAHLTLARLRQPHPVSTFAPGPDPQVLPADQVNLYQSLSTPQGVRYQVLGQAALR